ncbi:MAG: hypothetical protein OXD44_09440 [Gammaproteobacteria bacterium]|nr:hypothetical protein [Gammaproteobacteria bacterium]MCY4313895.1 hypothetical protein [Gammaproteobacteria bacterium]
MLDTIALEKKQHAVLEERVNTKQAETETAIERMNAAFELLRTDMARRDKSNLQWTAGFILRSAGHHRTGLCPEFGPHALIPGNHPPHKNYCRRRRRNETERLFRRLKGFDRLDVMFPGFIVFALVVDALRSVNTP